MFKHAVQTGIEGVIGKRAHSAYIGGRSKHWLKAKPDWVSHRWERATRAQQGGKQR
jgi:ATP-dependent DNA ligase